MFVERIFKIALNKAKLTIIMVMKGTHHHVLLTFYRNLLL